MSNTTEIPWCDATWNPLTGCRRVSAGCRNCYAERLASGRLRRLKQYGAVVDGGRWNGVKVLNRSELKRPLKWKKPRRIFVCSTSDLFFHEEEHIKLVFDVIGKAPLHTFLVLSKRHDRMATFLANRQTPRNVLFGVSAENEELADERLSRIVMALDGKRLFVSCEPMLGPINLRPWIMSLSWVIAGGESGPNARPAHPEWFFDAQFQCCQAGIPFFFKSWGAWRPMREKDRDRKCGRFSLVLPDGTYSESDDAEATWHLKGNEYAAAMMYAGKHGGRLLDGREWNELPESGK